MKKNPYITEDLELLAETAEKFAQKYVAPGFLERDQSRVFDRDLVKNGEMGFIAPNSLNNTVVRVWADWQQGLSMKPLPRLI